MLRIKDSQMTTQDAVQAGAAIFADVEAKARSVKDQFRSLRKILETINANGDSGALDTQAFAAEADALATQFEADIWDMHRRMTRKAEELGIDLPALREGGR